MLLSDAQMRLWLLDQRDRGSPAFNIQGCLKASPAVSRPSIYACLRKLIERHAALRARIVMEGGQPRCTFLESGTSSLIHTTKVSQAIDNEPLDAAFAEEGETRFDLDGGPLCRFRALEFACGSTVIVITVHHIIADGWSLAVLEQEFRALLHDPHALDEVPPSMIASKQPNRLEYVTKPEALAYWEHELRGSAEIELPRPSGKTAGRQHRVGAATVKLPDEEASAMRRLAKTVGMPLPTFLLTAYVVALHAETGARDVVVGLPVARRVSAEAGVFGLTANLVPLRAQLLPSSTFRSVAAAISGAIHRSIRHSEVELQDIVAAAANNPDTIVNLEQIGFNFMNMDGGSGPGLNPDISFHDVPERYGTQDLVLDARVRNGRLVCRLVYNRDRFSPDAADRIVHAVSLCATQGLADRGAIVRDMAARVTSIDIGILAQGTFPLGFVEPVLRHQLRALGISSSINVLPECATRVLTDSHAVGRTKADLLFVRSEDFVAARSFRPVGMKAVEARDTGFKIARLSDDFHVACHNRVEAEYLYRELYQENIYTRWGMEITPGMVVIDVGANIGLFSLALASMSDGSVFYAYEPIPALAAIARENFRVQGIAGTVLEKGVGAAETVADFTFYRNMSLQSGFHAEVDRDRTSLLEFTLGRHRGADAAEGMSLAQAVDHDSHEMIRDVPISTLANVLAAIPEETVHLLKVDAEHAEEEIILCASGADLARVRQIIVEVHDVDGRVDRICHHLEACGYTTIIEAQTGYEGTGIVMVYARRPDGRVDEVLARARREGVSAIDDFVAGVRFAAASGRSVLVAVCPPSRAARNSLLCNALEHHLEVALAELSRSTAGVSLIDTRGLGDRYDVKQVDDLFLERSVGVPYHDEFATALSAECAGRILRLTAVPWKAVVVDCDNTLWAGVIGECGVTGLTMELGHLALVRFLGDCHDRGITVCLCTRNNRADIVEALPFLEAHGLALDRIARIEAGWGRKSSALSRLAEAMAINTDSIIFIDDSPIEREEAQSVHPGMVVVDPARFPDHRSWNRFWPVSDGAGTLEETLRAGHRKSELERAIVREQSKTFGDYVKSLTLACVVERPERQDMTRAAQLLARTNQFYLGGRRMSEAELGALLTRAKAFVFVARVADRFADYGLTGVITGKVDQAVAHVDTFSVSCRILGRNAEWVILHELAKHLDLSGVSMIRVHLSATGRNIPALTFFDVIRQRFSSASPRSISENSLSIAAIIRAGPDYIVDMPEASTVPSARTQSVVERPAIQAAALSQLRWDRTNAAALCQIVGQATRKRSNRRSKGVAASNETEQDILDIWQSILASEDIGVTDDFFEIGGTSLLGLRMLSEVNRKLGVNVPIASLFEGGSVLTLAVLVKNSEPSQARGPRRVERNMIKI